MKKRLLINAVKFIVPVLAAGFTYFPNLNHYLVEKQTSHPFHKPEPHWDIEPTNDYTGVNRDKIIATVTGTNTVMTFGENNSNEDSY
jgi:hypothetical protein